MNAQNTIEDKVKSLPRNLVGGILLITLGLLFLVGQFLQVEWYGYFILATLAVLFLVSGLLTRNVGLLIPGGILSGISLGIWAQDLPFTSSQPDAAIFLLCFALGWALITVLSVLVGKLTWWPLIPGSILAIIGVALMTGGVALEVLKWFGMFGWPLILIGVGVYVLLRRK